MDAKQEIFWTHLVNWYGLDNKLTNKDMKLGQMNC